MSGATGPRSEDDRTEEPNAADPNAADPRYGDPNSGDGEIGDPATANNNPGPQPGDDQPGGQGATAAGPSASGATPTWSPDDGGDIALNFTLRDWLRVVRRGLPLALVTFGCLGLLLLVRLVERPVFKDARPLTPWITRFVCISAFVFLGMKRRVSGQPLEARGAVVSNHASWLDIFTLNASKRIYFVSKSEVAGWPGIGWLARATGTLFINRDRREARTQQELFERRLDMGHKLLFFPEGTSTDGLRVLPFKPTLFQAFLSDHLRPYLQIQPVSVIYTAPAGEAVDFYGWWGDMDFGPHLLKVLGARRQGGVEVIYHPPLAVADFADRKSLARACEDAVRSGFDARVIAG